VELREGICRVNTFFFNPAACCFLYKAKDLYAPLQLFKLGLTADPICERCLEDDESSIHILYGCKAVAYTRFSHLGQYFMEPSDYYDAPIDEVLHFIRSVGLIKG
jgi:hypothetical protein